MVVSVRDNYNPRESFLSVVCRIQCLYSGHEDCVFFVYHPFVDHALSNAKVRVCGEVTVEI